MWDLGSGSVVREFTGHRGPVSAMCCSSDGSLLATGGSDHTLQFYNLTSNTRYRLLLIARHMYNP